MRALAELAEVIVAGFAVFFGGFVALAGLLFLWLCGLASVLCLMVAAFAGVMFCVTGVAHDGWIALGYLGYAAVPFVAIFVLRYYFRKFIEPRPQQAVRSSVSWLSLARNANFTPSD